MYFQQNDTQSVEAICKLRADAEAEAARRTGEALAAKAAAEAKERREKEAADKAALDLLMSGGIVNDYSTRDMGWAVAPARLVIEPRRASLSPVGQSQ